ncbi:HPP family protein [Parvibaculum lavamentivorans DS-1]|uniref:HPP family protein n=1 Tax=Parvibaculum lavamentivorans (strain DS-1 / DSM 13023 / NCIMB 13966) TaxID=402881 RepID=A7HW74_PARL1|nr:HPP family protein [Parvibaculum lavamentivorans]ABS64157.1 HPP family protein [Parvibaculum lavamentivorans DS-1]
MSSPLAKLLRRSVRALGPAIPGVSLRETLRAGGGAIAGLGVAGLFVLSPKVDLELGLFLIAPFGASSVLLFAAPNSPLAQPWSAIVGNTLAALVSVAVCLSISDPLLRVVLAVSLSVAAMSVARAIHPPAGAVAMTAALSPDMVRELGFMFALMPVALGTLILVLIAVIYAHLTGRRYPFRQFEEDNALGTADPPPLQRLDLSEQELTGILQRYRQSLNLGVEDLARLIGAAELQAATHRTEPLTAAAIMSRDLVTVAFDTPLSEVADLFRQYSFTSLPVVAEDGRFLGIIYQIDLIRRAREDTLSLDRGFVAAMTRLFDTRSAAYVKAGEVMSVSIPKAAPDTPAGALLPMLAESGCDAVPVLSEECLAGIVTRTDLIAALARRTLGSAA